MTENFLKFSCFFDRYWAPQDLSQISDPSSFFLLSSFHEKFFLAPSYERKILKWWHWPARCQNKRTNAGWLWLVFLDRHKFCLFFFCFFKKKKKRNYGGVFLVYKSSRCRLTTKFVVGHFGVVYVYKYTGSARTGGAMPMRLWRELRFFPLSLCV
jgi:hypothetical protein